MFVGKPKKNVTDVLFCRYQTKNTGTSTTFNISGTVILQNIRQSNAIFARKSNQKITKNKNGERFFFIFFVLLLLDRYGSRIWTGFRGSTNPNESKSNACTQIRIRNPAEKKNLMPQYIRAESTWTKSNRCIPRNTKNTLLACSG
jgi:hypothetical protein